MPVSIPVIRSAIYLHFSPIIAACVPSAYPIHMRKPRRYVAKDGTESWRVRYRANGTEKSETFYDQKSAEEFAGLLATLGAARALDYIDRRAREDGDDATAITVDQLWQKWRAWKGRTNKRGELIEVRSARTLMDYDRIYTKRIAPDFGHMPANLITQGEVQEWIDDLSGEVEPKTIADYHSLLHGLFIWGIHPTRALVVNDPCAETRLPKRVKKQAKGLRPDEWLILHQAARNVDPAAADLLLFMASTGWRWSECVAVQALAVDHWIDESGDSQTWVTMGRVLRREGNHYSFVDDAKSDAGQRRIRIVGPGEEMVLRRLHGLHPEALLLTTKNGARWSHTHFYRRVWARPKSGDDAPGKPRILEEAARLGLRRTNVTPHWLRHTHVGFLILAGEPLPAIQKRLGHADIRTTANVYGRMIDDASPAGLGRVADLIGGEQRPKGLGYVKDDPAVRTQEPKPLGPGRHQLITDVLDQSHDTPPD